MLVVVGRSLLALAIEELLSDKPPSRCCWKLFLKIQQYSLLRKEFNVAPISMSSLSELGRFELPRAGRPLLLIACTRGDPGLTRLNNFRVRLVVHCSVLAQHTLSFYARPGRIRDARCIL